MYLPVLEAQHAHSFLCQNPIAFRINFHLAGMDGPIQLHYQAGGVAVKVNDETGDHLLPAEVPATQPVGSQMLPENLLFFRRKSVV